MAKTSRHARHYVGRESEINLGKSRNYGLIAKDSGPGSANTSGYSNFGEKERWTKAAKEIEDAKEIRQSLRDKKAERGKRRLEKKIEALNIAYERGQLTKDERDTKIQNIKQKHDEAVKRNMT